MAPSSVKGAMTLADLKRKPVVSMADGTKIGEVEDLVIDTGSWTVRELSVAGKSGKGLLALSHLKNIGPDAVTIERPDLMGWNVTSPGLAFEAVKKLIVVDGSGTVIGHVHDMTYEASGGIHEFEVHHGGVLGLGVKITRFTPADVRGVGDKLITVDLPVAETVVEAPQ